MELVSLKPKLAMCDNPKYLLISPAKDESQFIENTLLSVVHQSILPVKWIIVDDGSTDGTNEIVSRFAKDYPWIHVIQSGRGPKRDLGSAEILAFNLGYETNKDLEHEYIVKLDCDLKFERDYFQKILRVMSNEKDLGIVSGRYLELNNGKWRPVTMPDYHAAGASKVLSRKCFEEIGGFIPKKGWDTIDEIRAQMCGWRTTHLKDIEFYHLKPEGSAMGRLESFSFLGEIYYLTGGGFLFFLLKVVHRCFFSRPLIIGGIKLLTAYLRSWMSGRGRAVTKEESRFYRRLLTRRMISSIGFGVLL